MVTAKTEELKTKIEKAKNVALIVPKEADLDGVAGALALKHLFITKERKITVIFDNELPEEAKNLPGNEEIGKDLGIKDLILRFNIGKTPIDKISYRTEGGILSLRVRPKGPSFEMADFDYSYEGPIFDLLITFGIKELENLSFFKNYKDLFEKTETINLGKPVGEQAKEVTKAINETKEKTEAGKEAKSLCQFIFEQLALWNITPTKEASLCLLKGMSA